MLCRAAAWQSGFPYANTHRDPEWLIVCLKLFTGSLSWQTLSSFEFKSLNSNGYVAAKEVGWLDVFPLFSNVYTWFTVARRSARFPFAHAAPPPDCAGVVPEPETFRRCQQSWAYALAASHTQHTRFGFRLSR